MRFETPFVGNKAIVQLLERQRQSGDLASSYFFVGPRHIGKRTLAAAFARELSGTATADQLHLHTLTPDENGSIPIEGIRELRVRLSRSRADAHPRVVTIVHADCLTENAANALLKLLEEPPAQTYFILTAESLKQVPSTIISRCQICNWSLVPLAELKEVHRPTEVSASVFHEMAVAAAGKPGLLTLWLQEPALFEEYKTVVKSVLTSGLDHSLEHAPSIVKGLSEYTTRSETYFAVESVIRDLIHQRYRTGHTQNHFAQTALTKLSQDARARQLADTGSRALQLRKDLDHNSNAQLITENFLINL